YEHDQARGVFDRIYAVSDIAGMRLPAVHGAAKAMRALMRNDGLHGSRLADHASCRADSIFFKIANQSAYAEATDLLVITQGVMQWRVEPVFIQRGNKFRRLRKSDSDKSLHIRGAARKQLSVPLGGHEWISVPVLAIDRHHIRVPRQNQTRLLRIPEGCEQIGFLARRVVG